MVLRKFRAVSKPVRISRFDAFFRLFLPRKTEGGEVLLKKPPQAREPFLKLRRITTRPRDRNDGARMASSAWVG